MKDKYQVTVKNLETNQIEVDATFEKVEWTLTNDTQPEHVPGTELVLCKRKFKLKAKSRIL